MKLPICKSKWSNIGHFIRFSLIFEKLKGRWETQLRQLPYTIKSTGNYRNPKERSEPEPEHHASVPRRTGICMSLRMGRGNQANMVAQEEMRGICRE